MIPTTAEIVRAMYGCWYLALGRWEAVDLFDRSLAGYVRSFFVAVLVLPGFLVADAMRGFSFDNSLFEWISYGLRYAIYWLIFPLVACLIAERIGKLDKILDYLVPYNWVALPFGYAFSILNTASAGQGPLAELTTFISLTLWVGLLFVLWRWARNLLGVSGLMAFGFVLADELCSTIAYLMLEALTEAF